LVFKALSATVAIFGCFTATAMTAQRRSYLFLGGMLASAVGILSWMSLLNLFFRSTTLFDVELYVGLLVFSGAFVNFSFSISINYGDQIFDLMIH
jgi:hypothetical protein